MWRFWSRDETDYKIVFIIFAFIMMDSNKGGKGTKQEATKMNLGVMQ